MTIYPTILVVDDEETIREVVRRYLEREGYLVNEAADGYEALRIIQNESPSLIVLDLMLPGIDGFEVLRQIKVAPILKRLPVVVLTSSKEDGDRALSYDIGTNSYLVKPVSFEGFLGVIRQIEGYWLSLNIAPPENNP